MVITMCINSHKCPLIHHSYLLQFSSILSGTFAKKETSCHTLLQWSIFLNNLLIRSCYLFHFINNRWFLMWSFWWYFCGNMEAAALDFFVPVPSSNVFDKLFCSCFAPNKVAVFFLTLQHLLVNSQRPMLVSTTTAKEISTHTTVVGG